MIITLSPKAIASIRTCASNEKCSPTQHVERVLEQIFQENCAYFVLSPQPPMDKIQAIQALVSHIVNQKEFWGFKLLTKEEYEAALAQTLIEHAEALKSVESSNVVSIDRKETVN